MWYDMMKVNMCVTFVLLTSLAIQTSGLLDEPLSASRDFMYNLKAKIKAHKAVQGLLCPDPGSNETQTRLKLEIWPFSVLRFDEIEQAITTLSSVQMIWRDEALAWNVSDYNGIPSVIINYNEIWHPMIMIVNSAQEENLVLDSPMEHVVIYNNGTLEFFTASFLKTTCNLDLTFYPFDEQKCELLFSAHYNDECELNVSSNLLHQRDPYRLNGEWTILERRVLQSSYPLSSGDIPIVRVEVKLKRNSLYYTVSLVMPLLLSSAMSSLVFLIPPSSGEKVSFLVSVFISNSVFLSTVVSTMPRSLNDMPRLVLVLSVLTVESFLALLATLFVIRRFNREEEEARTGNNVTQERMTRKDGVDGEIVEKHSVKTYHPETGSTKVKKNHVAPVEVFDKKPPVYDTPKARSRWYISSRQWDVIFFVLYSCTSLPFYIGLFFL